jgi:hypothetical protein
MIKIIDNQEVIVDEEYSHLLERYWRIRFGYVVSVGRNNKHIALHRLIAGAQTGEEVDHINRNRLDNRKSNLRLVTRSQNASNKINPGRIGLRGVCFVRGKYHSQLKHEGKQHYLGVYDCPVDAAIAYDNKALSMNVERILNYNTILARKKALKLWREHGSYRKVSDERVASE